MAKRPLYIGSVPAAATAVYTGDDGFYTSVFSATVTNVTVSSATLEIWAVPDGETASDVNKVYDTVTVDASETKGLQALINLTLEKGGSIYVKASAADTLTLQLSGDKHA